LKICGDEDDAAVVRDAPKPRHARSIWYLAISAR
jgi:hypothetical protein